MTIVATVARLLGPLVVRDGLDDGVAAGDKNLVTQAALIFWAFSCSSTWPNAFPRPQSPGWASSSCSA